MRPTIKLLTLAAMVAVFGAPVLAQTKECNDEFKSSQYQKWYDNRKDHQDVAYQAAKEYIATCPNDDSPYSTAIKKFAAAYQAANESASIKTRLQKAYADKNYAEAVSVGKQVVQSEPDNLSAYIIIALSGYNATTQGNMSLLPDAEQAARKALGMIEAGQPFAPFASKDSAIGWMNYVIAKAKLKNTPEEALPYFLKAARLDNDLKKTPGLYIDLAAAYESGPRARLTAEYDAKYKGKDETPESKLALANIDQVIDRQIDAYARAAALTTNASDKKTLMGALTELYKYRNKSETGLNELVANILSKPLPDLPTPITSLPSTSTTTPGNSGSSTGTTGNTSGNTTSTGGQKTGSTSTAGSTSTTGTQTGSKATGTTKPSPSSTPQVKPKPRRSNHRRG